MQRGCVHNNAHLHTFKRLFSLFNIKYPKLPVNLWHTFKLKQNTAEFSLLAHRWFFFFNLGFFFNLDDNIGNHNLQNEPNLNLNLKAYSMNILYDKKKEKNQTAYVV